MDFSGYTNFPFPAFLTTEDDEAKKYFLSLTDETQLQLLNGCTSYEEFHDRVEEHRQKK